MTEITIRNYSAGEQMDPMCIAGEAQSQVTAFGITADLFLRTDHVLCPLINSTQPGSGNLDEFLEVVGALVGRPLVFVNVINRGLDAHLRRLGIKVLSDDELLTQLSPVETIAPAARA